MATYYVDSTKTGGANTGLSATDAWLLWSSIPATATAAGDIVYVSDAHNESTGADDVYSYSTNHTPQTPLRIICVTAATFGSTNVPVSGYGGSGVGQVEHTSGFGCQHKDGSCYIWGMRFLNGEEDSFAAPDSHDVLIMENCFVKQTQALDWCLHSNSGGASKFINCDFEIVGGDSFIQASGSEVAYEFYNCSVTVTGTNEDAPLIDGGTTVANSLLMVGCTMTLETGSGNQDYISSITPAATTNWTLINCVFDKYRPFFDATARDTISPTSVYRNIGARYASGDNAFSKLYSEDALGTVRESITVYRDASNTYDGTNKFSLEVVNDNVSTGAEKTTPHRFLLATLDPGNLTSSSLRVRLITDQGTLTDSEAWVECYAQDTTTGTQYVTTRAAPSAAGSNLTTAGEADTDWTGEPATSTAQRIDASFSGLDTLGPVYVYFCLATTMDGTTGNQLFVCPTVEVV